MTRNKKEYYTQVKLVNETVYYTVFIPSKFAIEGNIVEVTEHGIKSDWVVKEVYQKVELSTVKNQQHYSGNIWTATSGKYPRGNK